MKKTLAFAVIALSLSLPGAAAPERAGTPPWLVAEVAVCELDGKKVPHRTLVCLGGTVKMCGDRGGWVDTRKPC